MSTPAVTPNPNPPVPPMIAAPPADGPPNAQPTPPSAQQANLAHSAMVGHGFKSLVSSMGGTTTQYQQTPDGPQPVEVKNSGNDFFKHILAGAILGAGAGAEAPNNAGSGYAGAGAGISAVHANDQQQQLERQKQAQLQFQNKQAADKAAQESRAADTRDTMEKAQTQIYNYQAMKALQDIHQGDYTAHEGMVKDYAPQVATFEANGFAPVRQNVTEEDHTTWLKDHPGDYGSLIWMPVGVTNYVDKNNQIAYQTVWNAYDPKGKLEVSPDQLKDWKPILDKNPALAAGLKPDANGKVSLSFDAIRGVQSQANQMRSVTKQKEQDAYDTNHNTAELQHLADQSAQEKATAAASGSESALRSYQLKQSKAQDTAQTNLVKLTKSGKGWADLSDQDKVSLQPMVMDEIKSIRSDLSDPLLKEQLSSNDQKEIAEGQARATDLHQRLDAAQARSIFFSPTAKIVVPTGSATEKYTQGLSPTAKTMVAAAADNFPDIESARLELAKSTVVSDADREAVEAALEKYYADNKESSDKTAAAIAKRVKAAEEKNAAPYSAPIDAANFTP